MMCALPKDCTEANMRRRRMPKYWDPRNVPQSPQKDESRGPDLPAARHQGRVDRPEICIAGGRPESGAEGWVVAGRLQHVCCAMP